MGAAQTLPPNAIETEDGAFFPSGSGPMGFYVRDYPSSPRFWSLYDAAGGHSWYGPPISRVWEDATNWYQLFAAVLFVQPKGGGGPRLAPMVELIVTGPAVSSSFSNATKLEFDGWPKYGTGNSVHYTIQAFIKANPGLQTGTARSVPRQLVGRVRNLFSNLGLEEVSGQVRPGVLGQLYRGYFQGKPSRLPAAALQPEAFALFDQVRGTTDERPATATTRPIDQGGDTTESRRGTATNPPVDQRFGISDNLPGTRTGRDPGFGCTLGSEPGVAAGLNHMNGLGLTWSREQFLWNTLTSYRVAALPTIATDRNFRVARPIVGLLQFTPQYAGGGPTHPAKYNPPSGLDRPASDALNHYGQFVRGLIESRKPIARTGGATSASGLNPISRWIPWNEPDICRPLMPGYAWGGIPHARWINRTGGVGPASEGEIDDATREQLLYRLVQVAYDAMIAADPAARLIFPSLSLVDSSCDSTDRRMQFWDGWTDFLAGQLDRKALVANNFFFHDVSLTLHKEPERVAEIVTSYRTALNNLSESVGETDPLAGRRKIILMELGLQDDPGLGAYFDDVDVAHFIIQAMANAFVSGADEVALHKLVDYPLARPSGQGARVAVRYMSHISRQHPNRGKWPAISGERAAHAYLGPVRIDLPGPGFVTSVFYNRARTPIDLTLTFAAAEGTRSDAIHVSDHAGNERTLNPGSHVFTLAAPRHTFNAYGKNWAWIGGGTHIIRYSDSIALTTDPPIPETVDY